MATAVLIAGVVHSATTHSQARHAASPAGREAPCAALVTPDEIRSLGRKDALSETSTDRPGSSTCGWSISDEHGFVVVRQTAEWFTYEGSSGPKQSFDERVASYEAVGGSERIDGVGLEARLQRQPVMPTLLVRREKDVLAITCTDCTRDQRIAIAKAAATP